MRLTDQGKVGFTTLVIQLAVIDGLLSLSENHLIRLFADVLDIGAVGLDMIYEQVTGSKLPQPGDPSSIQWWEERTQQARQRAEQEQRQRESQDQADQREQAQGSQRESNGRRSQAGMSTAEAYVVLGLRPDATPEEITKVYRRAAQSHHPDRFAELGPEAQRAAHEMFLRIKAAYEVLA